MFFCFFLVPPLMYRLEVCLVSLYMLKSFVGVCMNTERQLSPWPPAGAAIGELANECQKSKTRGGRKEGRVWGLGRRIHALWRMDWAGGLCPRSTPLGLCKCIVSKFLFHV